MYYTQEQIDRANQADIVSFLQSQGEQLTRAGNEYRWKRHDSLTVRGNKWYRHSQSKGGAPIDFVMEFFGKVPCGTLCKTQHRINEDVVPIILLGVILACVLVFGFLYANNDIGKTANSLEADIRQSHFDLSC